MLSAKADRLSRDLLEEMTEPVSDFMLPIMRGLSRFKKGRSSKRGWSYLGRQLRKYEGKRLLDLLTLPGKNPVLFGRSLMAGNYNPADDRLQESLVVRNFLLPRGQSSDHLPEQLAAVLTRHGLKRFLERGIYERSDKDYLIKVLLDGMSRIAAGNFVWNLLGFNYGIALGLPSVTKLNFPNFLVPYLGGAFVGTQVSYDGGVRGTLYRTFLSVDMLNHQERRICEAIEKPILYAKGFPLDLTDDEFASVACSFNSDAHWQVLCRLLSDGVEPFIDPFFDASPAGEKTEALKKFRTELEANSAEGSGAELLFSIKRESGAQALVNLLARYAKVGKGRNAFDA